MRELAALIARYGLAGLANTFVGFAVVCLLDIVLGLPPAVANVGGYAVGIAVSFLLNRGFVFRSEGAPAFAGVRFLIAAAIGFLLNQGVLYLAGSLLGPGPVQHLTAQAMGMATYTVVLFILCRIWVFRAPIGSPAA